MDRIGVPWLRTDEPMDRASYRDADASKKEQQKGNKIEAAKKQRNEDTNLISQMSDASCELSSRASKSLIL